MENKYLVELLVPSIDEKYSVYIPVNRRVGNVISLLNKSIFEITNGAYVGSNFTSLYDSDNNLKLDINELVRNTSIKNGSTLVLL